MVGKNIVDVTIEELELLTPTSSELNLLDYDAVYKFMIERKPYAVIHAAGRVGGIQANMADPVSFLSDNTLMGFNVVNAAKEAEIANFLNLSSSCVYPKYASNPLREAQILSGYLEPTNEGYALAKISVMRLCSYISDSEGMNYKTLIPCNLYGKYDKFSPANSHMIPSVICRLHNAKQSGVGNIEIWGDGLARREFMYAEDLARYICKLLKQDSLNELPNELNVGLDLDYQINDYYQIIADVVGYKGGFRHDLSKPVGMQQKLMDSSIARDKYEWMPSTSLVDGISKTYQYFLEEIT